MLHNEAFWKELENLLNTSEIVVERTKNSAHPRFPDFIYPVDYGYVRGTKTMDGAELDIWVGTSPEKEINGILCTFDPLKKDAEIKIVFACTDQEIKSIYEKMNEVLNAIYVARC
jgi:inorganic pyrophosphatase